MKNLNGMKLLPFTLLLILSLQVNAQWTNQWSRSFNPAENSYDYTVALATDQSGAVYLAGNSMRMKQNAWEVERYVVLSLKYDAEGNLIWNKEEEKANGTTFYATAMACDRAGNTYTGGHFQSGNEYHFQVTARDPDGEIKWTRSAWDSLSSAFDHIDDIIIDSKDNIYVKGTGFFNGYLSYIIKYDPSGNRIWASTVPDEYAAPRELIVDQNDCIYLVTGDFRVIKYDQDGNRLWTSNSAPFSDGYAVEMALDNSGAVYVIGVTNASGGIGYRLVKYDPTGTQVWLKDNFPKFFGFGDWTIPIRVNSANEVYIGGLTDSSYGESVYKFDASGGLLWQYVTKEGLMNNMLLDKNGDLLWLGQTYEDNKYYKTLMQFTSVGKIAWTEKLNNIGNIYPNLLYMHFDKEQNLYMAGDVNANLSDPLLYKYEKLNTGIGLSAAELFRIYPNPASERLHINVAGEGNYEFILYDITGREIHRVKFKEDMSLDVTSFEKGMYIAEVRDLLIGLHSKNKVIIK